MAPGLAAIERDVQQFTRKLDTDTKAAGTKAGESLAEGMKRGGRARFVGVGREFAGGIGDGLKEEFPKGLASVGDRIKSWGRGLGAQGRTIGRGLGSHLGDGVKSGVDTMGRGLATGGRMLTGFAAGGVAALGLVGGAAAVMAGTVASANEQATISFTTMLRKAGDTEQEARGRAKSFIGDLQKLAATTPFEFADLQAYSSKLVSAGVNIKDIIPMMKNLGDVTSGVGTGAEGIDRATVALQQMIAAGKIQAEDLNQLRDAGIPVYDLLAGATGKSKKEIAELANSGKLGKKELDALLKSLSSDAPKGLEKFSGLMGKQSDSLKGMWSNLTDTVSQGLGRVGEKAMPELKRGLKGLSGTLSGTFDYLDKHSDSISRIFRAGGRAVHAFGGIIRPVLKAFTGGVTGGQDALDALADWLDTHQADITDFFTGMIHGAIAFGKATGNVVSFALRAYAGLSDAIGKVLEVVLSVNQKMMEAGAAAADAVGAHGTADGLRAGASKIAELRANNDKNDAGAAQARKMADAIDHNLLPGLDKAQDALDKYGKKARDAAASSDAWHASLQNVSRSVEENGRSLSTHSKAGKANRKTIQDAVEALNDDAVAAGKAAHKKGTLKDAEKAAAKVMRDGTRDLKDQTKKAGLNEDAVGKMIRQQKKQPRELKTAITFTTNADKVLAKLIIKGANVGIEAAKGVDWGSARGGIAGLSGRFMGQLPGHTPLSRGDDLQLPLLGGGRQHLRGGEGVTVTEAMDPYEQRRLDAMNHGVNAGMSPARVREMLGEPVVGATAKGGRVGQSALPASVMDLGPAARDFAVYEARKTATAYAKIMQRDLQKQLEGTGGGNTGAALKYARAHEGHPYVFGTLWDCSGFISALQSIAMGQSPHRRYVTPDFHGSKAEGFTRGKRSNFMVGVNPSPGKSGHMAATINGVNVESAGGVGVRVGGNARGYDSGMFSWRGGLAYGGRVRGQTGDMPMDLINQRGGQHFSPVLADLAEALRTGRGYAGGTSSAAAGFHWTGEKDAELVVNPQLRRYSGGEKVLQLGKGGGGGQDHRIMGDVYFQGRSGVRSELQDLSFGVRSIALGRK